MATSGPNQSGAVAEFDDGWQPWSNVANGITADSSFATCDLSVSSEQYYTNFLDFTTFGTFTGVGAGDSIDSITIEVLCKVSSGEVSFITAQILKGGSIDGSAASVNVTQTSTTATYIIASTVSLSGDFGTTLSGSELTSGFGVRLQFFATSGDFTVSVDAVRLSLAGTFTGGGGGGGTAKPVLFHEHYVNQGIL